MSETAAGQPLREALRDWNGLEQAAKQGRLAGVLARIDYHGRREEALISWHAPLIEGEPVAISTRRHPAARQSPPQRAAATEGRLPRITRLLALAVRFEGLLQDGTARDYAELARLGGVSRARITQIMSLRTLAPVIQERILVLPTGCSPAEVINERLLRGVAQSCDWREQMRMWEQLEGICGNRPRADRDDRRES